MLTYNALLKYLNSFAYPVFSFQSWLEIYQIYNPQRRLRVLVIRCRIDSSQGGLAFLIKGINYKSMDLVSSDFDLEIQGTVIYWKGKPFNIYNVYHPPNQLSLPKNLSLVLKDNSIVLGDLNAKHPSWDCNQAMAEKNYFT
ncbi:uncharacterized protein TNCV_661921 [Trichonephila clavipes]|nr:uncharacterized protein TNCV_661921 [Trichonephila clavipes]